MKISIKQVIVIFILALTGFISSLFYISEKQSKIREEVIQLDKLAFKLTQETNRLNIFVADYNFRQAPETLAVWATTLSVVEQQYKYLLHSTDLNNPALSKRVDSDLSRIRRQFTLLQSAKNNEDSHWITINLNTYNQNLITHLNNLTKQVRKSATNELTQLSADQKVIFTIITFLSLLLLVIIHSALIAPLRIVKYLLERIGKGDEVIDFSKSNIKEWSQLIADIESMYLDLKATTVSKVALESEVEMRRYAEQKANSLARTDFLTGLPNRRRMNEILNNKIAEHQQFFLLFLDIDNFKSINDNLGHTKGDQLLKSVGRIIGEQLDDKDQVARIGGDEFAILYSCDNKRDVEQFSQKIRLSLSHPFRIGSSNIRISCSLGIATYPYDGQNGVDLLARADTAMFYAKQHQVETSGIAIYTPQIGRSSKSKFDIYQDIKYAIENNEFDVWFQPQINIQTGYIDGFEALLRWKKQDGSFISPDIFVPLLEESIDIVVVGDVVIDKAIAFHQHLLNQGINQPVSINISAVQLERIDFIESLYEKLTSKGLKPNKFPLELTETAIIKNKDEALSSMQTLNRLGFSLQLDDFGTGNASLDLLLSQQFDTVKIDKSFTLNAPNQKETDTVIRAISHLSKELNFSIVLEGIEQSIHHDLAAKYNIALGQGYFYAKPMPYEVAVEWILNRQNQHQAASFDVGA